jgi:hypothetical protein
MNKYRLTLKKNGEVLQPNKDLNCCLNHLNIAHKCLENHLSGENHFGLLTNISNAAFEIKKRLK